MRDIDTTAAAHGVAYPNPNTGTRRRGHQPRDRYADAGRSAREALDRLHAAEVAAKADGKRVPASCARVLLEIVGHVTTYSRRNAPLAITSPPTETWRGGLVERTGLARNTVRRALTLLESYGCIVRVTPPTMKGHKTTPTVIALPIVERRDHDVEVVDPDAQPVPPPGRANRSPMHSPGMVKVSQTDPHPVTSDGPHRGSLQTDPIREVTTRSKNEGEAQRESRGGRSPVGRSSDRPPTSPGGTPATEGAGWWEEAAFLAAQNRMRDAVESGRGVDPADIRTVAGHDARQRDTAHAEARAQRARQTAGGSV